MYGSVGLMLAQSLTGDGKLVSIRHTKGSGMLRKVFRVGKWVVIADLSFGVAINAAWAMGVINPLGWGAGVASALQTTLQ